MISTFPFRLGIQSTLNPTHAITNNTFSRQVGAVEKGQGPQSPGRQVGPEHPDPPQRHAQAHALRGRENGPAEVRGTGHQRQHTAGPDTVSAAARSTDQAAELQGPVQRFDGGRTVLRHGKIEHIDSLVFYIIHRSQDLIFCSFGCRYRRSSGYCLDCDP